MATVVGSHNACSSDADSAALMVGLDVGSTTVKAVCIDPTTRHILWSDYQRHESRQAEKAFQLLVDLTNALAVDPKNNRIFVTGSGAKTLAEPLGAEFVQEVNAVSLAVESLHPDVGSVIELGGQDAKIIIFKTNPDTGEKQPVCSMNDKCASGTGATIDKCLIKVGMAREELASLRFDSSKLHKVAAKCGVFADTDIVNLVKSGIPSAEVICSLADAIVSQNLAVLTRGSTLLHKVLLLGRTQHLSATPARLLEAAHPGDMETARSSLSGGCSFGRVDRGSGEIQVPPGLRRGALRDGASVKPCPLSWPRSFSGHI